MYYEVEWTEKESGNFRRVFRAEDLPALWMAIKYINVDRRKNDRPIMKQIRIKTMSKYGGEYSDIIGDFDADMTLDADRSQ